jgi:GNAT superfamily N-acetyltransferase
MVPAVRTAVAAELPLLGDIERAADGVFAAVGIVFPPGTVIDEVDDPAHVLVAGDPPVAFAYTGLVDQDLHLHQIAVHPRHSRQGIGSALMAAVFELAGSRAVTLTTFRDVVWNGPWYARLGFFEVAEPGPQLAAVIAEEHAAGLDDLGPRVAMRRLPVPEHNGHPG